VYPFSQSCEEEPKKGKWQEIEFVTHYFSVEILFQNMGATLSMVISNNLNILLSLAIYVNPLFLIQFNSK